ncbi:MAG: restriction endonuclease subunit S [Polyangia bacterium]
MASEWKRLPLASALRFRRPDVPVDASETYDFAGVYSYGRGVFRSQSRSGSEFSYRLVTRLGRGELVYLKVGAWEGAFGIVPEECEGCVVSPEFPVFEINSELVLPRFLELLVGVPKVWESLSGGSTGTNARRRRLHPNDLLKCSVLVPSLKEQRAILAHVEAIEQAVREAKELRAHIEGELEALLMSAYQRITEGAPRRPLGEVAPLTRRPVVVDQTASYPQIAVRSFGRGTFNKPPLEGNDVTWEKPFLVEGGDLLISNIKAWEGAIAVVANEDHGRFASHRYLTCVANPSLATTRYICFHLLTPEGLLHVGQASPGSADRNRTLGAKALEAIPVPVPPVEKQRWFDRVYAEVDRARRLQKQSADEEGQLVPSIVQRLFAPAITSSVADVGGVLASQR